ncbi:bifunctional 4-hydroxy-2-oxoglutarate aldolase/2-dehydro-3-deoxy-phosphogluconate aldolase [Shouchella hunanensis]|uniref:Bifunctional 4-hydroxy-2-oxoglutarate aldolase/2-dehydro-3-deoxy-phosphogluconate aldolase n=1 Tax=Shouchella hunanensis TaxID=766894 RepID=A0ABY7W9Z0_9BACI|nr:bifunctional 4-hydroxy-2-oxoglutarate aldolase/2-dehydro-3-deoxy-phosphogluconate aldolase [Shouchella hunanensis]WDF05738.1 bifunctional 4-hydroxy-2-oxoglutarate aldolase/2-dehydro-3-deoxy-phosphogluconate aldolase [Shouchella hunanensis]GAF20526.1 4-hydroxy-2-oxoglutarate aldolase [Bacillus sp. JCM 19047]
MNDGLSTVLESGVCAVLRKLPPEKMESIADALVAGGVKGLEVTLDSELALETISALSKRYDKDVVVGAGTVLHADDAIAAIDAGAQFIFAPILSQETIEAVKSRDIPVIPGIFTPTEAFQAVQLGADLVKVFPAECVGPQFIKSVSGPLPQVKMMPTGGVNLDTIPDFIKAGAVAVGAGSSLLSREIIENNDWEQLTETARAYVEKVKESR